MKPSWDVFGRTVRSRCFQVVLVLLLAVPFTLGAVPPLQLGHETDPKVRLALESIIEDLGRRDFLAAQNTIEPLISSTPDNRNLVYLKAVCHYGLRQWNESLQATVRLAEIDAKWQQGYLLRGMILSAQADWAGAAAAFDKAVEVEPESAAGYYQRASFAIQYRAGDRAMMDRAIADLDIARSLGAAPEQIDVGIGLALKNKGDSEKAADRFRKVLSANPAHHRALNELTAMHDSAGRFHLSDRLLVALRESKPPDLDQFALIEAHHAVAKGDAGGALIFFQTYVRTHPTDIVGLLDFAHWLEKVGRIGDAVPVLEEGMRRHPDNPDIAAQLAWSMADSGGDLGEAKRLLRLAQAKNSESPYLKDTEAWIHYKAGDSLAAMKSIESAIALAETIPEVAYHAGTIYMQLGDREKALRYLRQALASGRDFNGKKDANARLRELEKKR
ncbi:MAG: tetratricopeptide repeat protein [Verrucomicrobiales bacterium]